MRITPLAQHTRLPQMHIWAPCMPTGELIWTYMDTDAHMGACMPTGELEGLAGVGEVAAGEVVGVTVGEVRVAQLAVE